MKIISNKEYLDMKNTIDSLENEKNEMYLKNIDEVHFYENLINDVYSDLVILRNNIKAAPQKVN